MDIKKITKIFVVAVIAGVILFDVYAFSSGGTEATVSWTIFSWSYDYPIVSFFFGFVMGHFFWQMKPKLKLRKLSK